MTNLHWLVGLVLVVVVFQTSKAEECVALLGNGFFYGFPQETAGLETCSSFSSLSCCAANYTALVRAHSDPIGSSFFSNILRDTASANCVDLVTTAECMPCSPSQQNWITLHSYGNNIQLCLSFCQQLFAACAQALFVPQNRLVSQTFVNADDFCHSVFTSTTNNLTVSVRSPDNSFCWDDFPACTEDDYFSLFTECTENQTRNLYFFWKPDAHCKGGVSLPPPITGLPCAISCQEGEFLKPDTATCLTCPAGTYSLGGGERIQTWSGSWSDFDPPFTTYCSVINNGDLIAYTGGPCGWELNEKLTNSGNLSDSMVSSLELQVVMVRDGSLRFTFMVDSEAKWDGLVLYIDSVEVMSKVSNQNYFKLAQFPLSRGFHRIVWSYEKDASVSVGLDRAFIQMIEIDGIRYADSKCSLCIPGQFSSEPGSRACVECPMNTIAMKPGSTSCDECEPNEYAYAGSTECTPRQPCTDEDYESYFTQCNANLKRIKYYDWLSPMICDSTDLQLPDPVEVECGVCNPGTYRPAGSPDCVYCPIGSVSDIGASECTPCQPGQYAMPIYLLYRFYSWGNGLETFCNYDCGSDGWRLRDTYIDSGAGHGKFVQSVLRLSLNITEPGRILFNYGFFCQGRCELSFTDGLSISQRMVGGPTTITPNGGWNRSYRIDVGFHVFEWTFTKVDTNGTHRNDRATLYSIRVQGSNIGGGINCTGCPAGFYGPDGKNCIPTPPGTYSVIGSAEPIPCANGYFQPKSQQPSCIPCGNATQSAADHLSCIVTCQYTPPENPSVTYNLWPLARTDEMYGPIYDSTGHVYFVNMCSKDHSNHSCFDQDGQPIPAYACQITTNGYGENLGDVIGFQTLSSNTTNGLVVQLTHGTQCPNKNGRTYVRQSQVTMICSPDAGIGSPVPDGPIVEVSYCYYQFVWQSLYACPICTNDYIVSVVTECQNGTRSRLYSWKYPKKCHDGVQLPANQLMTCVNPGVVCQAGWYYNFDTNTCTQAEAGYYSPGNGDLYDTWNSLPAEFSTNNWQLQADSIRSGAKIGTQESALLLTRSFQTTGRVEFTVLVTGSSTNNTLVFTIDETLAIPEIKSTGYEYKTYSADFSAGRHLLKWTYRNGDELNGATITAIQVTGVYYANEKQLPCAAGRYSESAGQSHCLECPRNTFSAAAATHCTPCAEGTYSDVGSASCTISQPCKTSDFALVPSACTSSSGTDVTPYSFVPLQPQICVGQAPSSYNAVGCQSCRIGFYQQSNGSCAKCSQGQYYSTAAKACKLADRGYKAVPQIGYFFSAEANWPTGFSTWASGGIGSNGWRILGSQIDSGSYGTHEADSILDLSVSMVDDGSISFEYQLDTSTPDTALQFTIDGVAVNLKSVTSYTQNHLRATVPVSAGTHTLAWIFHQKYGSSSRVLVSNILVIGDSAGGASEQTRCPAGYHSSQSGAVSCEICQAGTYATGGNADCVQCPSGTYSESAGASECSSCGSGTSSNAERTTCTTSCIFRNGNRTVDLSPLSTRNYDVTLLSRHSQLLLNICNKLPQQACSESKTSTYVCEIADETGTDAGHVLSAHFGDSADTLTMVYNKGSDPICEYNKITQIVFSCDLLAKETNEPQVVSESADQCDILLEWTTPYACPLCTDSDYELQATECVKGKQTVSEVRVGNCYGVASRKPTEKSCKSNHWLLPLVIISVALLFVLILGVAFAVVFWRHRRLENRYTLLLNETSKTTELDSL